METGAATLAHGVETLDGAFTVEVDLDAAAEVVGSGCNRNHVAGYVDAKREAFLVDVGEMTARLLRVLVGDIEVDVVGTSELHLGVDGTGHDVAGCKRETRVIFLHEFLAVDVLEYGTVATHGLGDEERGTVAGMV